ncbi:DUF3379 family protein [Thalassotalea ganghwensis]
MDDLQFRRSIYADPNNQDKELLAAMSADPKKQRFTQELQQLDRDITDALEVPVPEGLKEKLLLKQSLESHQQHKRKSRVYMAMAASVVMALGVTFNTMHYSHAYNSVADYAIAHTNHEAQHFLNSDENRVSLVSLNQKMASFNGHFSENPGELIAANFCRFDGMESLHLVFKGKSSPVNIYIVPNAAHLSFKAYFTDQQLQGMVKNYNQSNVIVVGDKEEPIEHWQQKLNQQLRWSA